MGGWIGGDFSNLKNLFTNSDYCNDERFRAYLVREIKYFLHKANNKKIYYHSPKHHKKKLFLQSLHSFDFRVMVKQFTIRNVIMSFN